MPSPPDPSSPTNAASRSNLFVEADPDELMATGARPASSPSRTVRRGRGVVVALDAPSSPAAPTRPTRDTARFTRTRTGVGGLPARARQAARRADRNARRPLWWLVAQPYGALIAVAAVVALLLAVGSLGLSLRDASSARAHALQQRVVLAALTEARARVATLTTQRDQILGAADVARRQLLAATAAADGWRTQAISAERRLAQPRHASQRHRRGR